MRIKTRPTAHLVFELTFPLSLLSRLNPQNTFQGTLSILTYYLILNLEVSNVLDSMFRLHVCGDADGRIPVEMRQQSVDKTLHWKGFT